MAINFDTIFSTLKDGVFDLAKNSLNDFVSQAQADGTSVLNSMKRNLQKWTTQLANKEMSVDDFSDLVLGQKDLLELVALKQAGLALIRIDQFRTDLLNLVVSTITKAI